MAVIIFLVRIWELGKTADLRGFQCQSIKFGDKTACVCWKEGGKRARRLVALLDMLSSDVMCFSKIRSTFHLNFLTELRR